jgi:hypothetical protein
MRKNDKFVITGEQLTELIADAERASDWAGSAARNEDSDAIRNTDFYTKRVWDQVRRIASENQRKTA